MVHGAAKKEGLSDADFFAPHIYTALGTMKKKKASMTALLEALEADWEFGDNFEARLAVALGLMVKDGRLKKKGNKYQRGKKNTQGVKKLKPSKEKARLVKKNNKANLAIAVEISDDIGEAFRVAMASKSVG